jgi:uncharacterized membrane-anchored protein
MNRRNILIIGLALPLLGLCSLAAYKEFALVAGKEFSLPIAGFDPRDLLSGHYITYRINFGINDICKGGAERKYICLNENGNHFVTNNQSQCDFPLKGYCRSGRFQSGLERFYIPQSEAARLDKAVRNGQGSIVVAVTRSGAQTVKTLLIDGESWQSEK